MPNHYIHKLLKVIFKSVSVPYEKHILVRRFYDFANKPLLFIIYQICFSPQIPIFNALTKNLKMNGLLYKLGFILFEILVILEIGFTHSPIFRGIWDWVTKILKKFITELKDLEELVGRGRVV